MSPTPQAGWYDDPEYPLQYRYWDGNEWTAHRSPKQTPPPPATSSSIPASATETVSAAFTLFGQHWVSLLGLAAIAMLGFAAAAVAFVIGLILSFENPNTLTGPDFVFSPIGVVLWIVAAVGYLGVFAVMGLAFQARIEAGRIGQSTSVGACIGFGTRNWKRTLWRSVLLMLTFFASYLVLIPLVLLAIVLGALGVFVAIVLGFAWFVAVVPAITLATAGVGIAPTGANVISRALGAARKDWALVSGRSTWPTSWSSASRSPPPCSASFRSSASSPACDQLCLLHRLRHRAALPVAANRWRGRPRDRRDDGDGLTHVGRSVDTVASDEHAPDDEHWPAEGGQFSAAA